MTHQYRSWRDRLAERRKPEPIPRINRPIRSTLEGIIALIDYLVNGDDDDDALYPEPTEAEKDAAFGIPPDWPDGAA